VTVDGDVSQGGPAANARGARAGHCAGAGPRHAGRDYGGGGRKKFRAAAKKGKGKDKGKKAKGKQGRREEKPLNFRCFSALDQRRPVLRLRLWPV